MIEIDVKLIFDTPPNIGSGAQVGTMADRAFIKARDGWPYIPATAFKGQLRHMVEQIVRGSGKAVCDTHHNMCRERALACPVCAIFGSPWIPGCLRFVDLNLAGPEELVKQRKEKRYPQTSSRYGVAISRRRGVAEDALLYTTELFMPGVPLVFAGTLAGAITQCEAAWVVAGLRLLPALGRAKSAGLGYLKAESVVRLNGKVLDQASLRQELEEMKG